MATHTSQVALMQSIAKVFQSALDFRIVGVRAVALLKISTSANSALRPRETNSHGALQQPLASTRDDVVRVQGFVLVVPGASLSPDAYARILARRFLHGIGLGRSRIPLRPRDRGARLDGVGLRSFTRDL